MSSGRRRSSKANGDSSTSRSRPSATQPLRQPKRSITDCNSGSSTIDPMPTPAKAMLIARPRRRTNQAGRKRPWHE
jgi:hypothetical protein